MMRKFILIMAIPLVFLAGCQPKDANDESPSGEKKHKIFVAQTSIDKVVKELLAKYGDSQKFRIERGVNQVANLWIEKDGKSIDFEKFCSDNFVASEIKLDTLFLKFQRNYEILFGYFNKISVGLKEPVHLDGDELYPIDETFAAYEASAHLTDDFYANKIAFNVALNFPFYSLKEKTELGTNWSRKQWAYARLGDFYTSRVPAELIQKVAEVTSAADNYISEYNIFMGNLLNEKSEAIFPKELKLITHWGLRDEIKGNYSNKANGLERQKMIYQVMNRIINQDIPEMVINKNDCQWNPFTNKVMKDGKEVQYTAEPNSRYATLLNNFKAIKAIDEFSPNYPTYIDRKFELDMEIPEKDVENLFVTLLSSPEVKQVASLISQRLGRKLEPFDIWYDGFKSRSSITQEELDKKTKATYPNREAFQKGLAEILKKLDFKADKASYIVDKIQVDGSRGAGHAWGATIKGDKARLRSRIGKDGMDYKGYNIAVHEFGHCVEQTLTLYDMDYYLLNGVPNTSFTEALAFLFQKRDLGLLGMKDNDVNKKHLLALDNFWGSYEIMGVSLVDMNVWRWLYAHPNATPQELKEAVITIAKDIWNKYYADVFGVKDQPILAIYSHMIDNPLYLPAYPVGHLIEFQLDKQMEGKNFADEVLRIYANGRIIPQLWMKNGIGKEISVEPLTSGVDDALKVIK